MAHRKVSYLGKPLTAHKALVSPLFNSPTVLATDTWDFVDLWLKREKQEAARVFWKQARSFAYASAELPKQSSPLTSYYCMLNAVKALLLVKNVVHADAHGVSGEQIGEKTSISNEQVSFKQGGVLGALCAYVGETGTNTYNLRDILYNLSYVHRAFHLSVKTAPELFFPVQNVSVDRSAKNDESWFRCEILGSYSSKVNLKRLGNAFEVDGGTEGNKHGEKVTLRMKKRFDWSPRSISTSLQSYTAYHRKLRERLVYIHGGQRLWYLKTASGPSGYINRSHLTLNFAAMHRLSEMSRYSPDVLSSHFDGRYNFLLSEFIATALTQFIDGISSEMTGLEFFPPLRASR